MVKVLYIMRHAKSDQKATVEDHERPLNNRGKKNCPAMGEYIKQNNIVPEIIISSTAVRAKDTAKRVMAVASPDKEILLNKKLYLASPGEVLKILAEIDNNINSAMIVFHNPGAQQLIALLCGEGNRKCLEHFRLECPTLAFAKISIPTDSWAKLDPKSGYLEDYNTPKNL